MKKFSWILLGSILLTGCSNYSEVSMMNTYVEEKSENIESQKYYVVDETILNQTKEVGKQIYKEYGDSYSYYGDSSGYSLDLDWEIFKENNLIPGDSEWAEKLDEVFPGIQGFMKQIDSEKSNKNPQSIVINNTAISIKPAHLYEENGGKSYSGGSYMHIENEPITLTDAYFKQLAQAVPKERFVVHTPYVMGKMKLLRFSTPSLENSNYITLYDEKGKADETYYEEKAVGYQLFVADDQLQKVRVVFNKIKDEEIEASYFDPLLSWCKNEWHMEEDELGEVQQLIGQVIQGKRGSKKGSFENYKYSYRAKQESTFRYSNVVDSSKYKQTLIEVVIEPK